MATAREGDVVSDHSELVNLLRSWLPRQRWFAGKGRPLAEITIRRDVVISDPLRHLLVEVGYADGGIGDLYQVPLAFRHEAPFGHEGFLLGESSHGLVYDGLRDPDGAAALFAFLRSAGERDGLSCHVTADLDDLPAHAVTAEQSNTSIIFGESYILKVFRRLWPGLNPDIEVTRALADAGSPHVARPLGWIDGLVGGWASGAGAGVPTSLAFLQEYLRSGTEGWRLATASVRDLYAEGDLHADEVGGDFAAESERLGAATAEVHEILAAVLPCQAGDRNTVEATAALMHSRLDVAVTAAPDLRPLEAALRKVYDQVTEQAHPPRLQRVHGDYHLGQVLRVDSGWVLFDFEGEPARPVTERTTLVPPLVDVAGMLRSFDYAARSLLLDRSDEPAIIYRAQEWADRNRDAFCTGYAAASGYDPRSDGVLLRAYELDKAVYEVVYEARHRPAWLAIPLGSIERLAAQAL
jgi:maltokinase